MKRTEYFLRAGVRIKLNLLPSQMKNIFPAPKSIKTVNTSKLLLLGCKY